MKRSATAASRIVVHGEGGGETRPPQRPITPTDVICGLIVGIFILLYIFLLLS